MDKDLSKLVAVTEAVRRIHGGKRRRTKMSEPLITRVSRALHGEHFLVPLARHLAVDRHAVRRWCAEQEPVWLELCADLAEHLNETRELLAEAKNQCANS
jgi:hypothetical protein